MEKKALKFAICLLIIPIIISIIIALTSGESYGPSNNYDSLSGGNNDSIRTYDERVRSSNTFVYISVFILVVVGVGVWAYVKKKGDV